MSGKGIIIKEPKTESSKREIVLSEGIVEKLKKWKTVQNIERLKMGEKWTGNFIFTQIDGKILHPDTISSYFVDFLRKNKISDTATLHSLRHR